MSEGIISGKQNNTIRKTLFGVIGVLGIIIFILFYVSYVCSLCGIAGPLGFLNEWAMNSGRAARMLVLIGMLAVIGGNLILLASYRTGKPFKGFMWIGGILIAAGFIVSSCLKIFALLGLFDLGIWELIAHFIDEYRRNKRFYTFLEEFGGSGDEEVLDEYGNYKKEICLSHGTDQVTVKYRLEKPYLVNEWDAQFAVIYDGDGKRFLVLDTKDQGPMPIALPLDKLTVGNVKIKNKVEDLVIEIYPVARHII